MGLVEEGSNVRVRTVWTPEMDRYFIDLMLEQVGKGIRRDDHFFSKREWNHMTTMFNTKFDSKYEKDVLKNRHKMLRNLHKALNNILQRKGFSWDASGQMVAADNEDWDSLVKENPNARPYRLKTVPYYLDLVKIYGSESTISGISLDCNENVWNSDVMIDEDFDSVGVRSRTYWQPSMDSYFMQLIVEQVRKKNHVDGLLRKEAWREMISLFNAKFGFEYGVDILKNRYKTLKRQHNVIRSLLEVDGFAWDGVRQMVVADDSVWQNYVKTHTGARQYMTRPIPHYEDLRSIFRELNYEDRYGILSHQSLEIHDPSPAASFSSYGQFPMEKGSSDSGLKTSTAKESSKRLQDPSPTTGSSKKVCTKTTAVSSLADARNEGGDNSNAIPVEFVVAAIQALPEMDEELVLDACDFLEDEKVAKTFMALDAKFRKMWLLRKLRPSKS